MMQKYILLIGGRIVQIFLLIHTTKSTKSANWTAKSISEKYAKDAFAYMFQCSKVFLNNFDSLGIQINKVILYFCCCVVRVCGLSENYINIFGN